MSGIDDPGAVREPTAVNDPAPVNTPAAVDVDRIGVRLQVWRFARVGVLNTLVDMMAFNLLVFGAHLPIPIANPIAVGAAIVNSFVWNKTWTFQSRGRDGVGSQLMAFIVVSFIGMIINTTMVSLLSPVLLASREIISTFVPSWMDATVVAVNIAKIAAVLLTMAWNFIGYKVVVFRR